VTAALLRSRFRVAENRLESVSFHVPVIRNGFRLRLLPAGHISGSAMLHVTRISDNASLLYTGDFKTRRSRTAEAVNFLTADTLILETTFGLPGYEFPNPMEVEAEVLRFIDDCFSDGQTPVLLGYSLGKAQEALALLEEHGIPALLHPSAAAMTRACRDAGVQGLPEPVEFDGHAPPGHVVIAPPNSVRTNLLKGLKSKRTAMLSGWALQPGAKFRYRVDAMIPFSDHADFPGLMECIQRVRPRRVLTVHGFEHEFAAELRSRQIDAWSAAGGDQMELPIQRPAQRQQTSRGGPWHKRVVCQLADFSDLCRLVTETGSRIAKTRFIASYLAGLEKDEDLRTAVNWLAAETPSRDRAKRLGILDASTLRHALVTIPGAREERYREIHLAQKELTRTARLFLQELQLRPDMIDLPETAAFLLRFRESGASMDRTQQLSLRLASLHPAEGETLIKLLTGNLRLGIDTPLVQEAIAAAFKAEIDAIAEAVRLTGDAGTTAVLARRRKLADACEMARSRTTGTVTPDVHVTEELPFPPHC
jgi:DNA ligase-1